MAWLNFDRTKSSNKKRPKKIKFLQMRFFLKKITIKIFMYFFAPFIVQNLKNLRADPKSYDYVPFLDQNDKTALNEIFFQKKG